ncbi:MAG: sensor domain-containing diguanylate cyclase [Candidatus Bipolaricaulota bacterium]
MGKASEAKETDVGRLMEGLERLREKESRSDIYHTAVQLIERLFEPDYSVLHLYEENLFIAKGDESDQPNQASLLYGLGRELSTLTTNKDRVMLKDDFSQYFPSSAYSGEFNSIVSVPIGDLGALQLFSYTEGKFVEGDLEILQVFATYLRERVARTKLEGEARRQAIHDQLTNLYNRHYLDELLPKEVERANRYDHNLSFLMVDINGFKEVNDRYSHSRGDKVLKKVADLLAQNVREVDTVFRYGGDEFLIILPETGEGSQVVVDRLKEAVRDWSEQSEKLDFPLTVAAGANQLEPGEKLDIDELLAKADQRMYEDKKKN